jgi:Family of unknown function (DUF6059)
MRRLRRAVARALVRFLYWLGWAACGIMAIPLPFSPPQAARELRFEQLEREGLTGPPPGHPERLVPDKEPTPAEQAVWSSLTVTPE